MSNSMRMMVSVLLLGILTGCDSVDVVRTYSIIEVTDARTADPVIGATVTVFGILTAFGEFDDTVVSMAPTDTSGRTHVPVLTTRETASNVVLGVAVRFDGREEEIAVPNRTGASAMGSEFSVQVIDTDASDPPPPALLAVEGTNPAIIEIDGYIRSLGVCSRETGEVTWYISSRGAYYSTIPFGSVPEGFRDITRRRVVIDGVSNTEAKQCPVSVSDTDAPDESFVIFARPRFGNDFLTGDVYCSDAEGVVIACEDE